jgi:hypothetical protein
MQIIRVGTPTPATGRPVQPPGARLRPRARGSARRSPAPASAARSKQELKPRMSPDGASGAGVGPVRQHCRLRRHPGSSVVPYPCRTAGARVLGRPQASKTPTRRKPGGGAEAAENRAVGVPQGERHPGPACTEATCVASVVHRRGPRAHRLGPQGRVATRKALRTDRQSSPLGSRCLGVNVSNGWGPDPRPRIATAPGPRAEGQLRAGRRPRAARWAASLLAGRSRPGRSPRQAL